MLCKSETQTIAIVGINSESARVLQSLLETDGIRVARIINDETEDLTQLKTIPSLNIIVNTSTNPLIAQKLKKLNLDHVDIIGGLSARLLFCAMPGDIPNAPSSDDRNRLLASLNEITNAIYLSKNTDEIFKLVLSVAIRFGGADCGSIMLIDEKKKFLRIEIAEGLDLKIIQNARPRVGKGIAGTVAKTGLPLLINGAADRATFGGDYDRPDLSSSLCVPLIIGDEVVGVLSIGSSGSTKVFTDVELRYLQKLAGLTADIIKSSKDFSNNSSYTFSLSTLKTIQDILNLPYPFEERLNLLLLKLVTVFKGEICNYYELSRDKGIFVARASSSFSMNMLKDKVVTLNDYFTREIVSKRTPLCVSVPDKSGILYKWYIVQPIVFNKQVTSVLSLHLLSDKQDLKVEAGIIAQVAEIVASEFSKNLEMESWKNQSIKLSAISELSFDLASAYSATDVTRMVTTNACLIMESESAILRLRDISGDLSVAETFSLSPNVSMSDLRRLDDRIVQQVTDTKKALLVDDLQNSRYANVCGDTISCISSLLEVRGTVIGILSLYAKKTLDLYDSRSFSAKDLDLFAKYCQQAAKAMQKFI